jgi:hypothetical protein
VRFRVSGDGTVTLLDAAGGAMRDVAQVVSLMPATFPKGPIAVGESWLREMSLPASGQIGAQLSGRLQVTFRLDSLARGGDRAFVSMRGDVHPVTGPGAASGTVLDQGLVSGTMVIDQKRHWLSESWFNVVMNSTVNASAATGGKPMRMQMRITQHMHTFDRR